MPYALRSRTLLTLAYVALAALAVLAILYSLRNGATATRPGFYGSDFRLLWLSGSVWLDGLNPYDGIFTDYYAAKFGYVPPSHFWVYPPQWFVLTTPLSLIEYYASHRVWTIISIACFACTAWLISSAVIKDRQLRRMTALFTFVILNLSQMSAFALSIGQTMPLIAVGVALLMHGVMRKRSAGIIAGLLILSLKPQFGLVFAAIVFAHPKYWRDIAIAGAIGVLLLLPSFLIVGPVETIESFLHNISVYAESTIEPLLPINQTGPAHLYYRATGGDIPAWLLHGGLIAAAAAIGWASRQREDDRVASAYLWILAIAVSTVFAPLHHYDLMVGLMAAPLVISAVAERGVRLVDIAIAGILVLIWRGGNFNDLLGVPDLIEEGVFESALLYSLLSIALMLGALSGWVTATKSGRPESSLIAPLFSKLPNTEFWNALQYGWRPS